MKHLVSLLFATLTTILQAQNANPLFEKKLADSLGADDYGMKKYVLVVLKTGKVSMDNKSKRDSLFRGHMTNMKHMAENGKLVVAGPLGKNEKGYEGIFVLNVKTLAEAGELLQTDPAVKSGLLDTDLFDWYGSAALPLYLKYHDRVSKKTF